MKNRKLSRTDRRFQAIAQKFGMALDDPKFMNYIQALDAVHRKHDRHNELHQMYIKLLIAGHDSAKAWQIIKDFYQLLTNESLKITLEDVHKYQDQHRQAPEPYEPKEVSRPIYNKTVGDYLNSRGVGQKTKLLDEVIAEAKARLGL